MIIRKELEFAGNKLIIESGKMAKQASGSVWVQYGDTVVLVAATAASEPREGLDFFPLTVEYREKTYAAGKFPGGFFKRETRPSETEILSARLIDRPIRPLFPNDFQNETQIIVNVISADRENNPDVLGTLGASISLSISDIPFEGPIASVRIGRVDGDYIINPTYAQLEVSDMELVVAGSMDSIMMVEGEAEEVPEETLVEAIKFAHDSIKKLVAFQQEIIDEVKPEKMDVAAKEIPEGLEEKVKELCLQGIAESVKIREKKERNTSLKEVRNKAIEALEEEYTEQTGLIKTIFHDVEKDEVRKMILEENVRLDGRGMDDVRDITCEVGLLPRAHGSALFTRGQTQSLGVVTLGTKSDEQLVETLEGESKKSYMLHYNFPPFCTGEVKPIRGTSRREIGHGHLAERALKPVLPVDDSFPYTIRIVSEVLESNGSSSMATVCSGSLSLMNAGVPTKCHIAGIAMGLIKEEENVKILTDILGDEDHLGDMDFKVAGSRKGISAVQMDIKIMGITFDIMIEALNKAKIARNKILDIMESAIAQPNEELSEFAPRILTMQVPVKKIGTVIGPSGKMIRQIIEETDAKIDIDDNGIVLIASPNMENAEKARDWIASLIEEPEVGKKYMGEVKRIMNFGAFVEFLPGKDGLVHISELEHKRVKEVTDVVNIGDKFPVILKKIDREGRCNLSRKDAMPKPENNENDKK